MPKTTKTKAQGIKLRDFALLAVSIALGVLVALMSWDGIWYLINNH